MTKARNKNEEEYQHLISKADKKKQNQLKADFEKKNMKLEEKMQILQQKLNSYQERLKDLETQSTIKSKNQTSYKQGIRDFGEKFKLVYYYSVPIIFISIITSYYLIVFLIRRKSKEFMHRIQKSFSSPSHGSVDHLIRAV